MEQVYKRKHYLYPDTLVGTDSHTTMVNALGVLGWGVGGIEAKLRCLVNQFLLLPEVVGFKIDGILQEGVTATDLVLTVVVRRTKGVVGKFVEFYGEGIKTTSRSGYNCEHGSRIRSYLWIFSTDEETVKYLNLTARDKDLVEIVEKYNKIQGLWMDNKVNTMIILN